MATQSSSAVSYSALLAEMSKDMHAIATYLVVGAVLFCLGLIGFLTRRNIIVMFLCTELMFQGVIVNLVGYSGALSGRASLQGQAFAALLIVVAAAEAALALGLIVLLFRRKATLDSEAWASLWG